MTVPASCRFAQTALLLAITLPFLGAEHYLPIATFRQEWLAGILGLLSLAALAFAPPPRGRWPIPASALALLAWVPLLALQFFGGFDVRFESCVLAALYLVWAFALMIVARSLAETLGSERFAASLAWALVIAAALLAATGALQRWAPGLGLPWIFPSERIIGNIAQPNNFADYLWLGVAAALWLAARHRLALAPLLPLLVWLMALSLLSGSRSVYFYAFAASGWLLLWSRSVADRERQRLRILALLLLPLLVATQAALPLLDAPVASAQRLAAEGSYDLVRMTLWRAAVDIFTAHPLLGAGFDSYSREFFARIADFPVNGVGIPEHSHNLVTEIAAEFGVAGLLVLAASAALWIHGLRQRATDPAVQFAGGLLLVIGIHALLEYPLWYAHFLALAAIALAIGDGHCFPLPAAPRHRTLLLAIAALGITVLVMLRSDYLRLEAAAQGRSADGAPLAGETQHADLVTIYRDSLLRPWAVLQFAAHMPIDVRDSDGRLAIVREATHFSPIRQAVFKQAMLLQIAGDTAAAERQWRLAALAYPGELAGATTQLRAAAAQTPALAPLLAAIDSRKTEAAPQSRR